MHYVAQLDLDQGTNARFDEIAARFDRISGLESVRRIGDVHHVSLGVYDDLEVDRFSATLGGVAETIPPVAIRLASIGIFSGPRSVLYLGLVVTKELLDLHRDFHAAHGEFASACWEHYLPGAWVPHVTLAMNVEPTALEEALAVLHTHWQPGAACLDTIRFIRFPPVETLYLRALSSARGAS